MGTSSKESYVCQHCGAEADMTLEGFERVEDVIKRERKLPCKSCGKEVSWTDREDRQGDPSSHGGGERGLSGLFEGCEEDKKP